MKCAIVFMTSLSVRFEVCGRVSFAVFSILLECCSLTVIDDLMTQDAALTG